MIGIVGSTGFVGKAFIEYFCKNKIEFAKFGRIEINGKSPKEIANLFSNSGIDFLINSAGFTGKPNVDACETQKQECLYGNSVLPGIFSEATSIAGIPWGHVSSGCIFNGESESPNGFSESMTPNFSFRSSPCSFYSGTKALGEEILERDHNCFIWRLRIPFNHVDNKRNYLSKLLRYEKILQATNSLSHLEDYVTSCIKCFTANVPKGIYNLTNRGSITTKEVIELLIESGVAQKDFQFFTDEKEFMNEAAITPRSNCVLDTSKANSVGVEMRCVREAVRDSLESWISQDEPDRRQ